MQESLDAKSIGEAVGTVILLLGGGAFAFLKARDKADKMGQELEGKEPVGRIQEHLVMREAIREQTKAIKEQTEVIRAQSTMLKEHDQRTVQLNTTVGIIKAEIKSLQETTRDIQDTQREQTRSLAYIKGRMGLDPQ